MASRLAPSQLDMIRDMISSKLLTTSQMAEAASCSKRSIITISANRMFAEVRAPLVPGGRPRIISPVMLEALCDHLLEKPDLYLDEMAEVLYDEFDVLGDDYAFGSP